MQLHFDFELKLWNDLMNLVNTNEAFYFKDHVMDGITYRVFSYRLARYQDFVLPNAMECRGHMFEMNANGSPARLASLPFPKFFNLNENPLTDDSVLDLTSFKNVWDKADGSLISTYRHGEKLMLKSKTSLTSTQAQAAMVWLDQPEQIELRLELDRLTNADYTVVMEWVAPDNRVVIGYEKPHLIVLGIRDHMLGIRVDDEMMLDDSILNNYRVKSFDIKGDTRAWIDAAYDKQKIEGFVVQLEDDSMFKLKTKWYLERHRIKFNLSSPRALFEAVINETIDDARSVIHDDPVACKIIDKAIDMITTRHNHIIAQVEAFYAANKDKDRKEFAIKVFSEMDCKGVAGLCMSMYLGHDVDYKVFALHSQNYKTVYGLSQGCFMMNEE